MYFKTTLHVFYLQKPFPKYFKSLVCFLHLPVVSSVPAKVLPEWGFGMASVSSSWGSAQQIPSSPARDPPRDSAGPISHPGGTSVESTWIRGTDTERRKAEKPQPEQKEVLHSRGTVAQRWAPAGASALPEGPWPMEGPCWSRRNKWEGRSNGKEEWEEESDGEKLLWTDPSSSGHHPRGCA